MRTRIEARLAASLVKSTRPFAAGSEPAAWLDVISARHADQAAPWVKANIAILALTRAAGTPRAKTAALETLESLRGVEGTQEQRRLIEAFLQPPAPAADFAASVLASGPARAGFEPTHPIPTTPGPVTLRLKSGGASISFVPLQATGPSITMLAAGELSVEAARSLWSMLDPKTRDSIATKRGARYLKTWTVKDGMLSPLDYPSFPKKDPFNRKLIEEVLPQMQERAGNTALLPLNYFTWEEASKLCDVGGFRLPSPAELNAASGLPSSAKAANLPDKSLSEKFLKPYDEFMAKSATREPPEWAPGKLHLHAWIDGDPEARPKATGTDDGSPLLRPVGTDAAQFSDLTGNVAEFARGDGDEAFIVGGSAFTRPSDPINLNTRNDGRRTQGFSDVGVRLAFEVKMNAAKHEERPDLSTLNAVRPASR
jgi:hypothetical protein